MILAFHFLIVGSAASFLTGCLCFPTLCQVIRSLMTNNHRRKPVKSSMEDIISYLPRHLIDCILECMPLQDAIRTSILSKKWRYIWAEHPQVALDRSFFEGTMKKKLLARSDFVTLITSILLLHSGPILKFILYIPNKLSDRTSFVDQWILFVSRNGVKKLTVHNSSNLLPYKLSSHVFACSELKYLNLYNCIFQPPPAFGGFCNMSNLYFTKITFPTPVSGALVVAFPLLQRLTFKTCTGIDHLDVHAPHLTSLVIEDSDEVKGLCLIKGRPKLTTASIVPLKKLERQDKHTELILLLCDLPLIRWLCFDGFFLKFLASGTVPKILPTKLLYLRHLALWNLGVDDIDQILCALCLLRSSVNLQKLEIWASTSMNGTAEPVFNSLEESDWKDLTLERLQTVRITLNKGFVSELNFIEVLLSNSPLLETMFVKQGQVTSADDALRISRVLMQFSRASPKAKIIFTEGVAS